MCCGAVISPGLDVWFSGGGFVWLVVVGEGLSC